jgi:hypothetical protein
MPRQRCAPDRPLRHGPSRGGSRAVSKLRRHHRSRGRGPLADRDGCALAFACQRPTGSAHWRPTELPNRGQQNCPAAARRSARELFGERRHPLPAGRLGESDRVAVGEHDVCVVQEPVDGRVGDRFRHQLVEAGGVQVGGNGEAPALIGGVDDAIEGLGGLLGDRQQPDVVDLSRHRDRSTYADPATIPTRAGTAWWWAVSGRELSG